MPMGMTENWKMVFFRLLLYVFLFFFFTSSQNNFRNTYHSGYSTVTSTLKIFGDLCAKFSQISANTTAYLYRHYLTLWKFDMKNPELCCLSIT